MAITRLRNDKQLGLSANPGSVMVSSDSNEATWLNPPAGDRILFYDLSANQPAWLSLGAGLSFNGTTLETSAGAGFISAIQEEGADIGAGVTTINFIGSGYTATKDGAVANITLDADLNAIADLTTTGFAARTGAGTWANREILGTAGRLSVTNGTGISGNPVLNIDTDVAFKNASETITAAWTFTALPQTNLSPTIGDHLVNKTYVDGLLAGVRRASVFVGTTEDITLSGEQNIDGVTTSASRVLVKDQADREDNGIYVSAAGAWARATDMDAAGEVDGTLVIIENGTQEGELWYTVSDVVTLGTDPIVWTKLQTGVIDGSGAANRVTWWSDSDTLSSNANFIFDSNGNLIVGHTTANSSTTRLTLRVADDTGVVVAGQSGGTTKFRVLGSGNVEIGASAPLTLSNDTISRTGDITIDPGTGNDVVLLTGGSGGQVYFGQGYTWDGTSGTQAAMRSAANFAPTSGSLAWSNLWLNPTINQTGGASGITYGINVDASILAASDFRGVQINAPTQTALRTVAGNVRFDLGTIMQPDAAYDMFYRGTSGNLTRLPLGGGGQTILAQTGGGIIWGQAPAEVTECFITGVTGATVDLDANTGIVLNRNGANIAFTVPLVQAKMFVYRGGQLMLSDGTGGTPSRDYSVDAGTHIITFNEALIASEVVYIYKLT